MAAASTRSSPSRVTLAAAAATSRPPPAMAYQLPLASSGYPASNAGAAAVAAAGTDGSRVAVPASATMITAPIPAKNQLLPAMTANRETEDAATAMAAVTVSR